MADWQAAFLSKVILDEEMQAAVVAGITTEFFRDERYQRVYEFLVAHYSKHGTAPDLEVVAQVFPSMEWKPQKQALSYLIEQMRRDRKFVLLTQGLSAAADHIKAEDADEMEMAMHSALVQSRLETSASEDADFTERQVHVEERLIDRMDNPGHLRGISTGFKGIDFVTGGLQPEQFVVLLGTPKSFKSATLLAMAIAVHAQAKSPLFIGFEMSSIEQEDRTTSLLSGVGLTKIMNGTLSTKEFDAVQKALRAVSAMRPFVFSTDITSATTVSGVQAKIQEYQPDVVFVDGAYLMQPDDDKIEPGSPAAMTSVSRGFKRLAQSSKIPIVVTTQASLVRSRSGLSLASGMYTQAWGQDCDVFLGVERQTDDKDQPDHAGPAKVKFRVIESRSGPRRDTLLEWDWSHGSVTELDPEAIRAMLSTKRRKEMAHQDDWDN
jgi:replicative DNA helicase